MPDVPTTDGWRHIGTAPKDGTFILLAGGMWGDDDVEEAPRVMVGRWYSDDGPWIVCCAEAGWSCYYYQCPSHWMPRPVPPE